MNNFSYEFFIPNSKKLNVGIAVGTLMPIPPLKQRSIPTEAFRLPSMQPCRFCKAIKFPHETLKFCCSGGEVSLYENVIPPDLVQLYSGSNPDSAHFRQYINPYNDIFAFTSMGVHLDPAYAKRTNGIYTFRAQGQIYHCINGLYPSAQVPSYLQLYFYDTTKEVTNRKGKKNKLRDDTIAELIEILKANPYSQFFRGLGQIPNLNEYEIRLRATPEVHDRTALPPTASQVAVLWIEDESTEELKERDIIVQKHDGHSHRISYYYGCYDPLQYPLLFPSGEPGWHEGIKKIKDASTAKPSSSQIRIQASHSKTADELLANEASGKHSSPIPYKTNFKQHQSIVLSI